MLPLLTVDAGKVRTAEVTRTPAGEDRGCVARQYPGRSATALRPGESV